MSVKRNLIFLVVVLLSRGVFAQSPYQLPGTRAEHISDRMYVLGKDRNRMSSIRNVERRGLSNMANMLISTELSDIDRKDLKFLLYDNSEYSVPLEIVDNTNIADNKVYSDSTNTFYYYENEGGEFDVKLKKETGVFGLFYKNRANFYELDVEGFKLRANPVLNISFGKDSEDERNIIRNTRGAEVRGLIDEKIYFYTQVVDNQRNFTNYIESSIDKYKAVPGHGTYKNFQSEVLGGFSGYDYFDATGYVGLDVSKHVSIEMGHGQHFIGNGIRSLLLSNNGDNYFYLKFNTKVWKLQYQNIFAELNSLSFRTLSGDRLLTKKYMASHFLSFKPNNNFEIGVFETVIFNRENHFEFQYLNPVILYRVIESGLGSPDNVILGLNTSYTFGSHYQIYGQLVLDEFLLRELKAGTGWWANKYGVQLGAKYYNAFDIDHLDFQIEYNTVRPYTYTHGQALEESPTFSKASYSHHSQPLAHPLGANFKEVIGSVKYQVSDKLYLQARGMLTTYGEDGPGDNNGNNILLVNVSRNMDFGNETGQGLDTDIVMFGINASYQFLYNYYVDLNVTYRNSNSELAEKQIDTRYVGLGLRVNMGKENIDY